MSINTIFETSGKTAMPRKTVSVPTRMLVKKGLIKGRVFHHGRGKADADEEVMRELGDSYDEYDPNYAPDIEPLSRQYDVVISNYVLNTLPLSARDGVWKQLKAVVGNGIGYLTVRGIGDKSSLKGVEKLEDGIVMSRGTFQKFFSIEELSEEAGMYFNTVELVHGSNKSAGFTIAVSDDGLTRLSQPEVRAIQKDIHSMPLEKSAVRFLKNGQALNIVTGDLASRGSNVMYHPVYWDMPRKIANYIGKLLKVRVDYQAG